MVQKKYAVVTGGSRGIGKQLCIELLQRGYFVITNYGRNDQDAETALVEFRDISDQFVMVKTDQGNEHDLELFINQIKDLTTQVHCVICNTGLTLRKNFNSFTNAEWEHVFRVNVHSHYYLIRDLDSLLSPKAKIIFIGSLLGEIPHASSLVYGVTKAAIHALARNLVKEFADRAITVNVVAPGFVETAWQKIKTPEIRQKIYNKTALKRFAKVDEITMTCMMVIENDFINGAVIRVDGGYDCG